MDFYERDDAEGGESPKQQQQRSRLLAPESLNALLQEEEASLRATLDKFTGGKGLESTGCSVLCPARSYVTAVLCCLVRVASSGLRDAR